MDERFFLRGIPSVTSVTCQTEYGEHAQDDHSNTQVKVLLKIKNKVLVSNHI